MNGLRAVDRLEVLVIVDNATDSLSTTPKYVVQEWAGLLAAGLSLIEFNAHWLSSLVGSMDKCWVTGVGQDPDWWLGKWDDTRPPTDQPDMAQLFRLNEKWPYPLMPSEYVKRQFHVSFQDDPVAVACRHITGVSSIVWGNDYPHAEGTFRGRQELLATQMAGVPDDERKALVGGTLADLLGFEAGVAA